MTETKSENLTFPAALAEAFAVGFSWSWDEETDVATGCDFQPYAAFEEAARTTWWLRLWTGNPEVTGDAFRFFGSTGAGDYAGFWLVRPGAALVAQPVVYVGSEGQRGVIARDLGDLLWLFAAGVGPAEAFSAFSSHRAEPSAAFQEIAQRYAPGVEPRDVAGIVSAARAEFPGFGDYLDSLCR